MAPMLKAPTVRAAVINSERVARNTFTESDEVMAAHSSQEISAVKHPTGGALGLTVRFRGQRARGQLELSLSHEPDATAHPMGLREIWCSQGAPAFSG